MSFIETTLYQKTKDIINRYGFIFKKNFGQNFLVDDRVLDKIIRAGEIDADDAVLEIGPGIGTLTEALAMSGARVTAVEIDRTLIPILENELRGFKNVRIINEDILRTDVRGLSEEYGRPLKVIANLPYYITTPIIMNLLEKELPVELIVVMIQKEVAMRMQAKPGSKDYGSLSIVTQYFADAYVAANVPRNCFMPRPNVDSALIRLKPHDVKPVEVSDRKMFFKFVKAAFSKRRKTLVNCITTSPDFDISKEKMTRALTEVNMDERVRGESLSIEEFALLFKSLFG